MKGFVADIEELTEDNSDYRHVLYTGTHLQLVLMALTPGEEIGEEVHRQETSSSGSRRVKVRSGSTASGRRSKPTTPSSFRPVRATMSSIRAASA